MKTADTTVISVNGTSTAEELLELYKISEDDLRVIKAFGKHIIPKLENYVTSFYDWLRTQPEFEQFFSDPDKLAQVQKQQVAYWQEFFNARIDEEYVQKRRTIGEVHARIGLPLTVYFAAMNFSLRIFIEEMYDGKLSAKDYSTAVRAVTKLMHVDTAVVVDTFMKLTKQTISEQSEALMEMSTPVTALWDNILMLPVVGIIDSKRSQDIMNAMLSKISATQSKIIILDISGVAIVDTAVANHLIKITRATKLMGCECLISGISPTIAQTVVELGIDVGDVQTTATLRDALQIAFKTTGVEINVAKS